MVSDFVIITSFNQVHHCKNEFWSNFFYLGPHDDMTTFDTVELCSFNIHVLYTRT